METVAEIIGDEPHVDVAPKPLDPPRHAHQPAFPTPGVYFGMPEEEYHAIHACSASGLKNLSISSMDYWARSLLNEEREEEKDKDSGKLTPKQLGRAYHTYIVEGEEAFNERYAVALDKDEVRKRCEDAGITFCVTIADIRAAIDALEAKPKGTSKDGLTDQLLDLDPNAIVWDYLVSDHNALNEGKLMISPVMYRRIRIADAMITKDPQLKDAFTGGHAEVSIFWYDEKTGVPMKARLDYLKMNHLIDLKSFGNAVGKPVQRAIDAAIANNKYFIPVVVYLEAIEAAKKLMLTSPKFKKPVFQWSGEGTAMPGPRLADPPLIEWCWTWAHQPEPEVLFIFQQTGIAPVTRGRIMPKAGTYIVTHGAVQYLKRKWRRCAEAYGTDPWVDFEPVTTTVDESINQWVATDFGDTE